MITHLDRPSRSVRARHRLTGTSHRCTATTWAEVLETRVFLSTYYVSTSGADSNGGLSDGAAFRTLQKAANTVTAGDVVVVRAGTYAGFRRMGTAGGTAASPITFSADPGVLLNAKASGAASGEGIINIENSGVADGYYVIQGFTVDGSGQSGRGIRSAGSRHNVIRNNVVRDAEDTNIFVSRSDFVTVEGNECYNAAGQHGIYVNGSANYVIRGNECYGNNWNGIHTNVSDGVNQVNSGGLIENNVVHDNVLAGMDLTGMNNGTLRNNLSYGNGRHGVVFQNSNQNPTIACHNMTVVNNTFDARDGSSAWAIQISAVSSQPGGTGVTANDQGFVIFNNILIGNTASGSGAIGDLSGTVHSTFRSDYNVVVDAFRTGGTQRTLASWRTATGQDAHTVTASTTALFVDAASGNYRLKAGAPALDVGVAAFNGSDAPRADTFGVPRPQGAGFDVGYYELPAGPISDTTPPGISSIASSAIGSATATITWLTNEPADTQVEFGRTSTYGSSTPLNASLVSSHSASLSGLQAGTLYHYRVRSRDAAGNLAVSADRTFTTAPPPDTTAPTASVVAPGVTSAGGTSYVFTVTYADNVAVNVSTVGDGDVTVSGPNGFSQLATLVSVDANTNGTPRVATYRLNAPGGTWDVSDNGAYAVSLRAGQVTDTAGNSAPATQVGSFSVAVPADAGVPIALFSGVAASAPHCQWFTVTYSDEQAMDVMSIGSGDIRVTGPNGFSQVAVLSNLTYPSRTTPATATYRIDAPGGSWDDAETGTYTVALLANQVRDAAGNYASAGTLGTFDVSAASTGSPTAELAGVAGAAPHCEWFTVHYSDNAAVDVLSLNTGDIVVTGPNGFSQAAVLANLTYTATYQSVTATYRIDAPGGFWDEAENGTYTVTLQPNQVRDRSGFYVPGRNLGAIQVSNGTDITAPSVNSRSPADGATNVVPTTAVTAALSESVVASTISFELRDASGALVAATTTYDDALRTVTLRPAASLISGATYTVTLSGLRDSAGNVAVPVSWSFSTSPAAPTAPSGLFVAATAPDRVELAWDDNSSNETAFYIERRTTGGSFSRIATLGANATSYVDVAVSGGAAYEYRVVAGNSGGDSASETVSVTTPVPAGFSDEFTEPSLGAAWSTSAYIASPSAVLNGGMLSLMGIQVRSVEVVTTAVEARLHFTARWQSFGLATGLSTTTGNSWAIIGTKATPDFIYARTNVNGVTQTIDLGPTPAGLHTYKVEPIAGGFNFYVDGVGVATIMEAFPAGTPAKLVMSDMVGVTALVIDWVRAGQPLSSAPIAEPDQLQGASSITTDVLHVA